MCNCSIWCSCILSIGTIYSFGMSSGFSECQTEGAFKAALSADLLQAIEVPSFGSVMNCIEAFSTYVTPSQAKSPVQVIIPKSHQFVVALNGSIGYTELFKKIDMLRKQGFFEDGTGLQLKRDHYLIVNGVENSIRAAMLLMSLKIVNPDQVLVYRDIGRGLDFNALSVAGNNQLYIDRESLSKLKSAYAQALQALPLDVVVAKKTGQSERFSLTSANTSLDQPTTSKIQQKVLKVLASEVFDMRASLTLDVRLNL